MASFNNKTKIFLGSKIRIDDNGNINFGNATLIKNNEEVVTMDQLTSAYNKLKVDIDFMLDNSDPSAIDSFKEVFNEALIMSQALSAERLDRIAGDNNEMTWRKDADIMLSSSLSTETDVRNSADVSLTNADVSLTGALSSEAIVRSSADVSLTSALSNEAIVRSSADVSLTSALSNEAIDRTEADTSLTSALSSEVINRANADTSLTNSLSMEESDRISADASLTNALSVDASYSRYVGNKVFNLYSYLFDVEINPEISGANVIFVPQR